MRACPKCGAAVFTGASDCARCGHVLSSDDPVIPLSHSKAEGSAVLGQPLFPTYTAPPRWLPSLLVFAGLAFAAIGASKLFSSEPGSCGGRGSSLCQAASKLAHLLYGTENPKLAEASLFSAGALLLWAFAWHLYSMWGSERRDDA